MSEEAMDGYLHTQVDIAEASGTTNDWKLATGSRPFA